jgi:hypothetical protein
MRQNRMRDVAPVIAIATAGCLLTGTPREYREFVTVTPKDAFSCALAVVDSSGYNVTSSDRAGGFLRASHIINAGSHDQISVTILPQSGDTTEVHVTAETFASAPNNDAPPTTGLTKPSSGVKALATYVLSRCGSPGAAPADTAHRS